MTEVAYFIVYSWAKIQRANILELIISHVFLKISSGMFISASEDKTGTLALIEEKIAKVTMIPKNHGEVIFNLGCFLLSLHEGLI